MTIGLTNKAGIIRAAQRAGLMRIDRHGWSGTVTYVVPGQPLNREQRRALTKQNQKGGRA